MRARLLPLLAAALLGGCLVSIGDARDDDGTGGADGSAGSAQAASSGSGGTTSDAATDGATGGSSGTVGGGGGSQAGSGGTSGGSGAGASGSGGTGGAGGAGGSGGAGGAGGGTGGSSGECVVPISDDFDDGTIGNQWTVYDSSTGFPPLESQGRLRFEFPDASISGLYAAIRSAQPVDLTNCSVFVHATSTPSTATDAYLHILVRAQSDYVEILKHGTLLAAKSWVGNTNKFAANDPYDPVKHAWWKIREQDGIIHFEVSADGKVYTPYGTVPAPFDPKSVYVWLAAGTWQPETNPGSASFDDLNISP